MEVIEDQLIVISELLAKVKRHHNVDSNTTIFCNGIIGVLKTELKRLDSIKHKHQAILDTPIELLRGYKISGRTIFLLEDIKAKTIGDILNYSKSDVRKFRNVGVLTINELTDFFKSIGIDWQ